MHAGLHQVYERRLHNQLLQAQRDKPDDKNCHSTGSAHHMTHSPQTVLTTRRTYHKTDTLTIRLTYRACLLLVHVTRSPYDAFTTRHADHTTHNALTMTRSPHDVLVTFDFSSQNILPRVIKGAFH